MGKDLKRICLNKSVLDFMERVFLEHDHPRVLEFGSGWSSSWFAARCTWLYTFETSMEWYKKISKDLVENGHQNWEAFLAPYPNRFALDCRTPLQRLDPLGVGISDITLIDCREDLRYLATKIGWQYTKRGGWLILDDAQRKQHSGAILWMQQLTGSPIRLTWEEGDLLSARDRVALAWQKR